MLLWLYLLHAVLWAHPFGSDLYGHRAQVWLDRDRVQVAYLAEIPTPVLLRDLRRFLAGTPTPTQADQDRHTAEWLAELEGALKLVVDGEHQPWERLEALEASGVGDARFIQYHLLLTARLPEGASTLNLINGNLPDRPALFSTEVFLGDGLRLDATSLVDVEEGKIAADRDGQWRAEEGARELRLSFVVARGIGATLDSSYRKIIGEIGGTADTQYVPGRARLNPVEHELLPSLVKGEVTPLAVLIAVLMAILLGALHAFAPGHGKALVAAYLLGERKTVRHAVGLGGVVTVAHTITVFALGGVALALSEVISTATLLPWLEVVSGLLVLGVGVQLVRRRLRPEAAHHHHHHHDQGHEHEHDHDHHHGHDQDHADGHAAEFADVHGWRDLVALGISGGIAPCPSAMVLLLTAVSFHRTLFGLVLVFFFSLGLALVVTSLGIAVVLLGDRLRALPRSGRALRLMPIVSAAIITLLGVGITAKGVLHIFNA